MTGAAKDSILLTLTNNAGSPTSAPATSGGLLGDVNKDGIISVVDALLVSQYYVGLPVSIKLDAADTNCNGSVDILDALLISQYYVGLISRFC